MKRSSLAQRCCSSTPSAMCFWATVFLFLYGAGLLLGTVWPALGRYGDTVILTTMAGACFINFGRNRTLHCGLTGPIFVVGAIVAALVEAGIWNFDLAVLWGVVLVLVALSFVIEWRTFGGQNRASNA